MTSGQPPLFIAANQRRKANRLGWQASATLLGSGRRLVIQPRRQQFARQRCGDQPREPWPLLMYRPSSHGQATSGTCRASLLSAA
jgi:hypothetical protein